MRALILHPNLGPRAYGEVGTDCRSGSSILKVGVSKRSSSSRLDEAIALAKAIGLRIAAAEVVGVPKINSSTYFGQGKVSDIKERFKEFSVDIIIVDNALSPVQQRNLERVWACKVIDRTALILEIFGARARTKEGKLQVELASLSYQKSRLVRSWTHLERQRGGGGFLGGPGETQIESDRRQLKDRITRLKRDIRQVVRTRALHRASRKRVPYPLVALVGYTNAGKSTLFNLLTGANVRVKDQLFATLDPTMRLVKLPSGRKVIFSDTVGFVSELPHDLVASFRATLEEVRESDLILHVRDISHDETANQRQDVHNVLMQLDLDKVVAEGLFEVFNKTDLMRTDEREQLLKMHEFDDKHIPISALNDTGVAHLLTAVDRQLSKKQKVISLRIILTDGATIAWLYRHGQVIKRFDINNWAHFEVSLSLAQLNRLKRQVELQESTTKGLEFC